MKNSMLFYFFICIVFISSTQARSSLVEAEHYKTNSTELKEILRKLSDTCDLLFTCSKIEQLVISPTNRFETKGEVVVRALLLIEPNTAKKYFSELGMVVLRCDSVDLLIRKDILFNSCLKDSLEYLGTRPYLLKYGEFENCLNNFGIVFTFRVFCLGGSHLEFGHFGAYLPRSGQKKLDKTLKRYRKN
ncbi:MAG: hypothetical protein Q8J69_07010 [Sphingobacteriaceae bacterium]|nr:hypothetical protein [Sphingobacteriaceae bacterium]